MFPQIPAGVSPAFYFVCVGLAVLITGIGKTGFGGGIGILAVPLMVAALPPQRALGITLEIFLLADVFANLHHMRRQSWPHFRWLLTGDVAGIAVASALMAWLSQTKAFAPALSVTIGVVCLFFVGLQVYRLVGGHVPHIPRTPGAGRTTGLVAGVLSTMANSAGSIVNIYLLEQQLDKSLIVGTAALFFFVNNLAKVPTYVSLGLINQATLVDAMWTIPLIPVGSLLGYWLHRRIPEKPFVVVMYSGAALAAVYAIYQGVV